MSSQGLSWKDRILWLVLISALVGVSVAALRSLVLESSTESAKPENFSSLGTVPDFQFVDERGKAFGRSELLGRVWIVDFIYTSCPSLCVQMSRAMRSLQGRLEGLLGDEVRLVSVSVDPRYDTPERLSEYASAHGARSGLWHFLTGSRAQIFELCRDHFRLAVSDEFPEGAPEPVTHSDRFVVIDRDARIRAYFRGTDEGELEKLIQTVHQLVKEGSSRFR
ncbi:MAG: SCO family protein [Planctomycetota bacterium]|jgi:protein SCO1/2|nr:SCO family protein [Planctomycetota bacterium]